MDYEPYKTMRDLLANAAWPLLVLTLTAAPLAGQDTRGSNAGLDALDSLVALALETNPAVLAARHHVDAVAARIAPAGTLPDPMIGAGILNLPIVEPGFSDPMTMSAVAVEQSLPFPGKLSLARRAMELELEAARADLESMRLEAERNVRAAYYAIALHDRSLEILERNQRLLVELIASTESRYAVGTGGQAEVLTARLEATRLAEEAVELTERRRGLLADLNAVLARSSDTPVILAAIPQRIVAAAVTTSTATRFASATLGSRLESSPIPPLDALQRTAIAANPALRAHEARIAAQEARVELARRSHLPDFELSLMWGQRFDRDDMVSLMVMMPLPVHRTARQDASVAGHEAELAAMRAEHHAMVNGIRADVARFSADLEAERSRLALFVRSVLPQSQAALESVTAAFQVGRADFMAVLENQATLYNYETEYHRALTDFAIALAELERVVGRDVLP